MSVNPVRYLLNGELTSNAWKIKSLPLLRNAELFIKEGIFASSIVNGNIAVKVHPFLVLL